MTLKKQDVKKFTARYKRIMMLTFLVVLLISAAILGIQIREKIRYDDRQLVELFKNKCLAIDNLVDSIGEHVDLLQIKAEMSFIEENKNDYETKLFKALKPPESDPDYFSLDQIPPPYQKMQVGNLTGYGTISNNYKDEIAMALGLNSIFIAAKKNIPNAQWIYYTSKNNFINIYPWVNSNDFKFTQDLYSKPFFALGLPENNPERKRFWTEAYLDEAGAGKMVTAAKPVYKGDTFLGTVAIDVTFDELLSYVRGFNPDGTLMIVNAEKQLIAHPTLASSKKKINSLKDALFKIVRSETIPSIYKQLSTLSEKGKTVRPVLGRYKFTIYKMVNAPWSIVYIPDKRNLFLKYLFMKEGVILTFITLIFALTFMLIITNRATWREFISPSEKLVRHISNENCNIPTKIPDNIPIPWNPWFNAISKAFEENRSLIKVLREDKKRYMPNYVLVVSINKDCGSTTIGNYIARSFANADEKNKKTLYMEYPFNPKLCCDFDMPEDQNLYPHPAGYDIRFSYDLSVFPEEVKTSMLMNEIIKNYNNIVINTIIEKSLDADTKSLLEHVKVVVFLYPLDDSQQERAEKIFREIRGAICQDQTFTYTLLNRSKKACQKKHYSVKFDHEIPFMENGIGVTKEVGSTPEQVKQVVDEYVNRTKRVVPISLIIPSTVDVNIKIDPSQFVKKTLAFCGEKFGGATSTTKASGVWNSQGEGLVNEDVYIVMSYTTDDTLKQHLDEVFEFVRNMKEDLRQEKMAMEINQKLILV
jgi:hypothetical protein